MNIWIYAISKNERQFCERFMASCAGADGVLVLDTGSDDGTAERLRELGAVVSTAVITPWRFDTVRNVALELVPEDADVCLSLDLDEVLAPGWRESIEAAWAAGVTRGRYLYVWSHDLSGGDGVTFYADKLHSRRGYHWRYPVHEVLEAEVPETQAVIPGLRVDHWPDNTKSRSSYLPLLELAVREDPANDRNTHYLGREYMFHRRYGEAMETLLRHLSLPTATWKAERAASMRYIAHCCDALGDWRSAAHWLERAADEAPTQREGPFDLAMLYYRRGDWALCRYWAMRTLAVTERDYNYMTDPAAWGPEPYDLSAIANWHLGHCDEALDAARAALELAPGDERLRRNVEIIQGGAVNGRTQ